MNLEHEFDKNWQEESKKHAAITIRNEVRDWCESKKPVAEKRWLWELIQNSVDAAKGNGVSQLTFAVRLQNGYLVVRHNGGPFLLKEIVALVSGGTSKRFGREALGQFGKGFLVTHVLSRIVSVDGLLSHAGEGRRFHIQLNRDGDERNIEENINACKKQLSEGHSADEAQDPNETIFTYYQPDALSLKRIANLHDTVPYVMLFNPSLRTLTIDAGEGNYREVWNKRGARNFIHSGHTFDEVSIETSTRIIKCVKVKGATIEIGIQLAPNDVSFELIDTRGAPVLYYQNLPLSDSDNVEVCYAVNSTEFDIDSDRSFVNETPDNSRVLGEVGGLLETMLDYLDHAGVSQLHLLGHVGLSSLPEDRMGFLRRSLSNVPRTLLSKRIVACKTGAVDASAAHIPSGRFLGQRVRDLTPMVYQLLAQLSPEVPQSYLEWEEIASEWGFFDVRLQVRTLESLIESLETDLQEIAHEAKTTYVTALVKALKLAQLVTKSVPHGITTKRFLLSQRMGVIAPQEAHIDSGVDDQLKEIATLLGWDIRSQLLHKDQLEEEAVKEFIAETLCAGRDVYANELVIKRLWESYVSSKWKTNYTHPEYHKGLVKLLIWLMLHKTKEGLRELFSDPRNLPVLNAEGEFKACSEMEYYALLWPDSKWNDDLRPYIALFPPRRVMSAEYLIGLQADQQDVFLKALASLWIAYQGPCFKWASKPFDEREAKAVASPGHFSGRVKIEQCADVVGLQDMTSAVAGSRDLGRGSVVIDFILAYIIEHDSSWTSPVQVGENTIYPSYWLSVLKTKDWLPSPDGKSTEPLGRESLERLLGRRSNLQLTDNAISFLGKHFEINRAGVLALRLRNLSATDSRVALIDRLMNLPAEDALKLAEETERYLESIRKVRRNQSLGALVETAVKAIFDKEGFQTEWTGIGSDFRLVESDELGSLKVSNKSEHADSEVLIEVKATNADMVRLTLAQARTAISYESRYILCVADLGTCDLLAGLGSEGLEESVEAIRESLRFTTDISQKIGEAVRAAEGLQHHQVELKETEISPGIRIRIEESEIRLAVMRRVWQDERRLEDIVAYCRDRLRAAI